jgi:lysophospholipase L1-like esterase
MRALLELISIVSITFIIVTCYSFTTFEINLFGVEIRKSKLNEFLATPVINPLSASVLLQIMIEANDSAVAAQYAPKTDTSTQRILLIGDSMLEGLMRRVRDYSVYNKHFLKTVIWYSSTTKVYGTTDTLAYFIKKHKPTYIILSLGANEMFIRDIKERRQDYVYNILNAIGDIPYVWLGPPNWREDTGINELILENVGPKRYYESKQLTFQRASDGVHPTHSAARIWMDSVAVWIQKESQYRIRLDLPDKQYRKSANVTMLSSGN